MWGLIVLSVVIVAIVASAIAARWMLRGLESVHADGLSTGDEVDRKAVSFGLRTWRHTALVFALVWMIPMMILPRTPEAELEFWYGAVIGVIMAVLIGFLAGFVAALNYGILTNLGLKTIRTRRG